MNATTQAVSLDLGAMMEQSLDSIPEAPDFANPPAGEYKLSVKEAKLDNYETKKEPGVQKQRLRILYAIEQTVSVAGNEPPMPDGTMFSETFQGTEQGLRYFKKRIKEVMNASDLTGVTLGEMMSSVKGQAFDARITIKKSENPNDKDNPYENVNIRVIPPKA